MFAQMKTEQSIDMKQGKQSEITACGVPQK
jgi:hypothetical protein